MGKLLDHYADKFPSRKKLNKFLEFSMRPDPTYWST